MTRSAPSPDTLRWVERVVGGSARVIAVRRLRGGIASVVHRLRLDVGGGGPRDVVLRRWTRDDWGDTRELVADEVRVLTALERCDIGVAVPRLLGASVTGDDAGGSPALVMDHLPGRIHLRPGDGDRSGWLGQMATTAARIHALDIEAKPFESWMDTDQLRPPSDTRRPDLWDRAHEVLRAQPPGFRPAFVHRDYQHFNLLWVRNRMTAVLDWGSACSGPTDIDIGHCRLNLAVLFSPEWADEFLRRYEAEAGRRVDPWWDLAELCVYGDSWPQFIPVQVAGRREVDTKAMTARVEAVVEATLRRM